MAYIATRFTSDKLAEIISPEAYTVVMQYFKDNPRKTVFKAKSGRDRIVIYKYTGAGITKYSVSVL